MLFSKNREFLNKVKANFKVKAGRVIRHVDQFDFWKGARQAIGWSGYLS